MGAVKNAKLEHVTLKLSSAVELSIKHHLLAAGTKGIRGFLGHFQMSLLALPRNASLLLERLILVAIRNQTMTTPLGDR